MKRVSNRPGPGGRKNEERKQSDKMEMQQEMMNDAVDMAMD